MSHLSTAMFLNAITGHNVKGISFSHELKPVTLFVGNNATGKTARLDAIRLLLKGYLPRLGVQASSTMSLAGADDPALRVLGTTFNGHAAHRIWTRGKGGKIEKDEAPFQFELPDVMIDPASEFFKLSAAKRIDFVFQSVKTSQTLNPDSLIAEIKNLSFDPNTEDTQSAVSELVERLTDSVMTYHQRRSQDSTVTFQVWLDEEVDDLKERLKTEKQNVDRMSKSIAASVQLNTGQSLDLIALDDQQSAITKRIAEIDADLIAHKQKCITNQNSVAKRASIQAKIDALPPVGPEYSAEEIATAEERVKQLTAAIAEETSNARLWTANKESLNRAALERKTALGRILILDSKLCDFRSVCTRLDEATAKIGSHVSTRMLCLASVTSAQASMIDFNARHATMVRDWQDRKAKLEAMIRDESCPFCHSHGAALKDAVTLMLNHEEEAYHVAVLKLTGDMSDLRSDIEAKSVALAAAEDADAKIAAIIKARDVLLKTKSELIGFEAERKLLCEAIARTDSVDAELATVTSKIEAAGIKIAGLNADLSTASEQLKTMKAAGDLARQHSLLVAEMSGIVVEEVPPLPSYLPDLRAKLSDDLATVQQNIKKAAAERQSEILRKRASDELAKAKINVMVLKSTCDLFAEYRAKLVDKVFGPVISLANRVFEPVLGKPLVYRDGLIGYGDFVPSELFSGAEEAVTFAGIALALATQCPLKIMIFDELGRLSQANKGSLIKTVLNLIKAGVIDQFIGVDVDDSPYASWLTYEDTPLFSLITVS